MNAIDQNEKAISEIVSLMVPIDILAMTFHFFQPFNNCYMSCFFNLRKLMYF